MAKKLKSMVVDDLEHCLICGSPYVHIHHVFFGTANRKISDRLGLIVPLCEVHHLGRNGVHMDRQLDLLIKGMAQDAYEKKMGSREDFMRLFGRNYL